MIKQNRLDDLQVGGLKIYQNDDLYSFTSDAVLLANFDKIKKNAIVVDFGTGSGVIPILIAHKTYAKKVYGIEIQTVMSNMAKQSVEYNKLQDKIEIINDSIQNATKYFDNNSVDIVVCNPPYSKMGTCKPNESENIRISRHEVYITLDEIFASACKILKEKGELRMVHQTWRMGEIIETAGKYGFRLKMLRLIQSFDDHPAHLALFKFGLRAGYGTTVLPTLMMNNPDGTYTDEVRDIYRKEKL